MRGIPRKAKNSALLVTKICVLLVTKFYVLLITKICVVVITDYSSEVIDFINKGITRISANTKSIQVIITSRPAAFSDTVGFSTENYPHFELTDITPPIINEYVEKWIKASKLVYIPVEKCTT